MNRLMCKMAMIAVLACASAAWAQDTPAQVPDGSATPSLEQVLAALSPRIACPLPPPLMLDINNDNSVYDNAPLRNASSGVNGGGVKFKIDATYLNKYVYRGVDHDSVAPSGNTLNLLVNGEVEFDFGKAPHPFFGALANIYDSDPVSRFQEVLADAGARWTLAPFTLEGGLNEYIYPNRESLNTDEVYGKLTVDDSFLFHSKRPVLHPYLLAAYDYERANGWYLETGIQHDFVFEDIGLTLTPRADVAWIANYKQNFIYTNSNDNGFQHADVGLELKYSLNTLLNVSRRFGQFDLKGYLFYTDKLQAKVTANNVIWGGVGIGFSY